MFAEENGLKGDPRLQAISESIRVVPHFPKQGIMFQDITTLLLDHKAFKDTVDIFVDRYRDMDISVVAGVEARGFMFGPSIALGIGAKFIPLRKPRKLPGEVISEKYDLEYGTDILEMHVGAVQPGERALVIDDLVATGGTLSAAIRLLERVGAEVVECACVIGVPEVKGHCTLIGKPLYVLVEPRQIDNCFKETFPHVNGFRDILSSTFRYIDGLTTHHFLPPLYVAQICDSNSASADTEEDGPLRKQRPTCYPSDYVSADRAMLLPFA